jgi:hypothetical protein
LQTVVTQKENKLGSRLVKVFNAGGMEGVDQVHWNFTRLLMGEFDDDLLTELNYDFLFNPLRDGDFVAFRGFRCEEIGRIRIDSKGRQEQTEVMKRVGNHLVIDRLIRPIAAKYMVLLPKVKGYHCAEKTYTHEGCIEPIISQRIRAN